MYGIRNSSLGVNVKRVSACIVEGVWLFCLETRTVGLFNEKIVLLQEKFECVNNAILKFIKTKSVNGIDINKI